MTLTASLLLDIVLLVLLVYWFAMGVRRGLILTLCSLLSVVLGLAGGWYLAVHCSQPLQEQLAPLFTGHLDAASALAAKAILFLVGFVGVQLAWTILCHALDLVAKLPGLHFLNKALGGLLGLLKGVLILLVAQWVLCDLLAWIPPEVAAQSRVLILLTNLPLLSLTGG